MSTSAQRVRFIDFMRGFAVVVMVMGHSIDSVLSLDVRSADAFRLYDSFRGFTGPLFLFISGFAFYIVTSRKWGEYTRWTPLLRKRVVKMLLLLGLGYALHFPFFSLNKILHDTTPQEYAQMFQVDVLHAVAVSILLLQLIVLIARSRQRFFPLALAGTILLVIATPFLWGMDLRTALSPFLAPYFNQQQPAIFPVFPFGAYLFAGALAGWAYEWLSHRGTPALFPRGLVLLAGIAGLVGIGLEFLPWRILPAHDFWKASPNLFLVRSSVIMLIAAGFTSLRSLPPVAERHLVALGQASLIVYVVHLMLVYGSAANPGLMQIIGQTLAFPHALAVALAVLMGMLMLVSGWRTFRNEHARPSRIVQHAVTNALIYFFLTKPY